jgi:hypothetical protein
MPNELSDAPQSANTWFKNTQSSEATGVDDSEWPALRQLALDEAEINRLELEKMYSESYTLTGELRYHLLWRLSQLERKCHTLDRCVAEAPANAEELERIRKQVSETSLHAVQLRQEARLLINANRRTEPSASARRKRVGNSGTSGRRYPNFAGV